MKTLIIILVYLIAAIPNALWIGKLFKNIDLRTKGSGNLGSTNSARVLGYKLGLLVLILDISKGFFPLLIFRNYIYNNYNKNFYLIMAELGLIAILAHSYSIFLNFQGGKSVATMIGVYLVLVPKVVIGMIIVFLIIELLTDYVSLASMLMAISAPIFMYFMRYNKIYIILGIIVAIFIAYRHKSNISRLINGTEAKFRSKV